MQIEGKLITVFFHDSNSNYTIAKLATAESDITICGYFPPLEENITYRFNGEYVNHPKYGRQFKVSLYEQALDDSREGVVAYLSSEIFTGIGPKTAALIYDKLGSDCIEKIINDETILRSVGLSEIKIARIYNTLIQNQGMQRILIKLYQYGITSKMAYRLYQKYGIETIEVIEKNPYCLIDDVPGYSFMRTDQLALSIGIARDDKRRIRAAICFSLRNVMTRMGYTFLYTKQLISVTSDFLNVESELVEKAAFTLIKEGILFTFDNCVFLPDVYNSEKAIAEKVLQMLKKPKKPIADKDIMNVITLIEKDFDITYNDLQRRAIINSLNQQISIITGGPGTGKTTVVRGLISAFKKAFDLRSEEIGLMAPTGRAAMRLQEATDLNAMTIHRHLGFNKEGGFLYNAYNQLPYKLIIIDEASMIDVFLAAILLAAISDKCQIVFVGDANQLPSVGPGSVLNDLIESKQISTVRLEVIQRQSENSSIIELAQAICAGSLKENIFYNRSDLFFIECHTNQVAEKINEAIGELIKSGYDLWEDIQVLVPMYKGPAGIDVINRLVKKSYNVVNNRGMTYNDVTFHPHDKVLQTVNNPDKGVMNGDLGVVDEIVEHFEEGETVIYLRVNFAGLYVLYSMDELSELVHAYAISVHKSQGSEYRIVILPVVSAYIFMLKRNLIYTGVTRAKEKLFIIGDLGVMRQGIEAANDLRQTLLKKVLVADTLSKEMHIPGVPFTEFGEYGMENITPYDFLDNSQDK